MARPVKDTPILRGKDARRFNAAIQESAVKKISSKEHKKLQDSFNKFKIVDA